MYARKSNLGIYFPPKKKMQNQPQNFMYVCCDFLKATTKKQNLDSQEHNININI